jgi:NAD(P)-dependent dehydrogenase (short-subunit alcohol dehydrogenase family)
VLVTGGGRGIGAAIVKRLAREGDYIALTYVSNPDQANETVRWFRRYECWVVNVNYYCR